MKNLNIQVKLLSFILLFISLYSLNAQTLALNSSSDKKEIKGSLKQDDRVCFVGNSITNNGQFHHNIMLYYLTRFPNQRLTFFNCGVSGDRTSGTLNRMEDDIMIHNPTVAVIMLGMNDVNRSLYGLEPTKNVDTLKLRFDAIESYKVNMEKIINVFLKNNVRVIFQKPTIYDQTSTQPEPNHLGVNDALKTCADFIEILSKKYNLSYIDYWTIMNRLNTEMQKNNPEATITGKDRVHPGATGHLVMAYQFLKKQGAPKYVSKIILKKNKRISTKKSINCEIKSISKNKKNISFRVKENALPFPTVNSQKKGLELIPFNQELNLEILQVPNLKTGQYELIIDGKLIDKFSAAQFSKGINLAQYIETPQNQQAIKVLKILDKIWELEAALRGIKFIEYDQYYQDCPDKENLQVVKSYLDSIFSKKYKSQYYNMKLKDYVLSKPNEANFKMKTEIFRKEAYELAKPKEHLFVITRK